MTLTYLGNVLGSVRYFGSCFLCRAQFCSTHEMVGRTEGGRLVCAKCARKANK